MSTRKFFGRIFICCLLVLLQAIQGQAQESVEFTFAHVSDVHFGQAETAEEDLRRTIADINNLSEIEFVIITGDITEFGADEELHKVKSILDTLQKPYYLVPGNHDANWSESGANTFKHVFGSDHIAFEAHGYLFVGTSSGPNMRMAPGLVPHDEIVWLRSVLDPDKIGEQPVIFFNHYPMNEEMANWYEIIDILKQVNIQAILNGHGHINMAYDYEGIPGVMARYNLRGSDSHGGYNIATVRNDSLSYSERTPGLKTHKTWQIVELKNHYFKNEAEIYPRPSYDVNEEYPEVSQVWGIQEDSDVAAGIVAGKELAYYPTAKGDIVARNILDGNEIWRFSTTGMIYSTPALEGANLVVASTDSTIYNLDAQSGKLLWKVRTGKSIVGSPTIDKSVVYIGSSEGIFRALDLYTGKILWEYNQVVGFVETKPLVDEKRVYFGSWGNYFYALDKNTGTADWTWTTGSPNRMFSPAAVFPVKANGKIFISAPDRAFAGFDAETGVVTQRSNHYKGRESIGISEDGKYIYVKAMQDTLFAYASADDNTDPAWILEVGFGYEISPSPIVEYNNLILIPTDKGVIYAVDRKERKVKWIHKISNALINNIFPLSEHSLLTTTMDGKIVRLEY